jgi:tetratricopeptide (TPR) repeat protein
MRLMPPRLLRVPLLAVLFSLLAHADPTRADTLAPKKYALLVGVNNYDHARLPPLKYAENDATDLARVLTEAGYEVVLLTGAAGARKAERRPTKANIEARLEEVLCTRCKRGDTVLVALAGHGLQFAGKREAFFCPSDARPFATRTDTLLSLTKVYRELDESFAGVKLLLVDACRNDPESSRGVDDTAPRPPRGVAALFSCSAGERAFETKKLGGGHGVFFHFVLEGLKGEAKNRKGAVTWGTLVEYVREQVSDEVPRVIGAGARQTPHLMADERGKSPVLLQAAGATALERGLRHVERREYDQAIEALSEAIRADSASVRALRARGDAYFYKKAYTRAIADYDQVLRLNPRHPGTRCERGIAATDKGDLAGAIADFTEAIRLDKTDTRAYFNRGLILQRQRKADLALEDFKACIRLQPRDAEAYHQRGRVYRDGKKDLTEALADFNEAIRINPHFALALRDRGLVHLARKDYARALKDFDRAVALAPRDALAQRYRGEAALLQRKYDEAIKAFTAYIELKPDDPDGYQGRAFAYEGSGDSERAAADQARARRLGTEKD